MKHYKLNDTVGNRAVVISEEEYIALTHYFGKKTINVLKCIDRIGAENWIHLDEFCSQLPYDKEGIE